MWCEICLCVRQDELNEASLSAEKSLLISFSVVSDQVIVYYSYDHVIA